MSTTRTLSRPLPDAQVVLLVVGLEPCVDGGSTATTCSLGLVAIVRCASDPFIPRRDDVAAAAP